MARYRVRTVYGWSGSTTTTVERRRFRTRWGATRFARRLVLRHRCCPGCEHFVAAVISEDAVQCPAWRVPA